MANPNITSVSSIYAGNFGWKLTASLATLMTVSADKFVKINSILAANVDATATLDLQVSGMGTGAADGVTPTSSNADIYIAKSISVPAGSTISVIDKPIYLKENDVLKGNASVADDIDLFISFEVIDDA